MEEKPAELPVSPQEVQIQAPVPLAEASSEGGSFLDKVKIHKFKILGGVLGVLVFVGISFTGYKLAKIYLLKQTRCLIPEGCPPRKEFLPPVATPTPDPTANWKTYTNTEYGYSVKYPPEMESKELEPNAAFGLTGLIAHNFIVWGPTQRPETEFYDGLSVTLGVVTNSEGLSLKEFADKASQPVEGERESFKEIQVGDIKGFKAVGTGLGRFTHIFLPYKTPDKVVQITAIWGGEKKEEYQEVFNLMLSTFRFLPSAGSTSSP